MASERITLQAVHGKLSEIEQKLDQLLDGSRRAAIADGQEWLSIEAAAEICGFKAWTLRQACASGRLGNIDPNGVRKLADGSWRIWWGIVDSIRNNGLPKAK